MIFWEIMTFKKIKERVSEAPLVVELNVDFCFWSIETLEVAAIRVLR